MKAYASRFLRTYIYMSKRAALSGRLKFFMHVKKTANPKLFKELTWSIQHFVLTHVKSSRHVPANTLNNFKRRLFRLHNPALLKLAQKAVDVFPRTIAHIKIQGFPVSQPPKSTFSADGKLPENPVFKPFFRRLFVFYICHQHHALNVA